MSDLWGIALHAIPSREEYDGVTCLIYRDVSAKQARELLRQFTGRRVVALWEFSGWSHVPVRTVIVYPLSYE